MCWALANNTSKLFSVACMMIGSAAVTNVWRIQRYLEAENGKEKQRNQATKELIGSRENLCISFFIFVKSALDTYARLI